MPFEGFYPLILATFKFIERKYGYKVLQRYWRELAEEYYREEVLKFREGGISEWERFWKKYLSREPRAEFNIEKYKKEMHLHIKQCPAYYWLKEFKRRIPPWYCEHCRVMLTRMAEISGVEFTLKEENGSCLQIVREKKNAGS